jgi:pimeloyl-ACP methyl ester carboxylesterase
VSGGIDLGGLRTVDIGGPVRFREWPGPEDGPTFVCVHGLGGSSLNWVSIGPGLSRHGRVVALDLAGFGLTPRAGRSSSLSANRRLLSAFVGEVARPPVVLVGNSMGGALAALQAAHEPDSVAGLVLTSPALPWNREIHPAALVLFGYAMYRVPSVGEWFVRQRVTRLGPDRLVAETFRVCCVDPSRIDPAVVRAHVELATMRRDDPDAIPAFLEAARSLLRLGANRPLARQFIERVAAPVLVIHGARDRLVPIGLARDVVRRHPSNWQLAEFADAGHVAMLEVPDRWLEAVAGWLEQIGLGPSHVGDRRGTDRNLVRESPPA